MRGKVADIRKNEGGKVMGVGMYENVFIGNFIYALGVKIGITSYQDENKREFPACVNLLQQTPADKISGDLLASFPGSSFLIEFKNEKNNDDKELEKHKLLKNNLDDNQEMREISKLSHWFIQIDATKGLKTKVLPYYYMDISEELAKAYSFDYFIEKIVTKIFNSTRSETTMDIGVLEAPMLKYLEYIKDLFEEDSSGSKKYSLGGLIVTVTPDGGFTYVLVNDIVKVLKQERPKVLENTIPHKEISKEKSRRNGLHR